MTGSSLHDEQALRGRVSRALLSGLVPALILMSIGTVLALVYPAESSLQAIPFAELPAALARLKPMAFLSLGMIFLFATPALRVVVLLEGYGRRRQWVFVLLALSILGILGLSIILGLGR